MGSTLGSKLVSGDSYIEQSFGYYYSHLWRNYAIVVSYFIFFILAYGLAVEFVPQVTKGRGDILIFLRNNKRTSKFEGKQKETREKIKGKGKVMMTDQPRGGVNGFGKLERSRDSFTWEKLEYHILVKGGTKKLLTGIHGYVKPGTMTGELIECD
jgi:hypothetical protein